jgi:tetratricopeptide (TPR) repeat protein
MTTKMQQPPRGRSRQIKQGIGAGIKNKKQVAPAATGDGNGPIKKRDRNFHPELRILASRASEEEQHGRSKSPVTKHPLDSAAFRFASREVTTPETRSLADTDDSTRSGNDDPRVEPALSQRVSENPLQGKTIHEATPINHPLLVKDRTTLLKESFKVRFVDEMSIRSTSSSELRTSPSNDSNSSRSTKSSSLRKTAKQSAFVCGAFIPPDEIAVKQAKRKASAFTKILDRLKCTRDTTLSDDDDFDVRTADEFINLKVSDAHEVHSYIKKTSSSSSSSRISQIEQKLKSFESSSRKVFKAKGEPIKEEKAMSEEVKRHVTVNVAEGDLYANEENFKQAIECYMAAVESCLAFVNDGGEIDVDVFRTVKKLRDCHHIFMSLQNSDDILQMGQEQENLGRFLRAVKFYTVAYRIRRDTLGDRHASLVKLLNMMGSLQTKRGHIEDAMTFVEMAEELQEETDAGLVTMAVTARNKGSVHEFAGRFAQALDCYHESFRLHRLSRGVEWDLKTVTLPADMGPARKDPLLFELVKKPEWKEASTMDDNDKEEGMEVTLESSLCYYNVSLKEKVQSQDVLDEIDANVDLAMTLHSIGRILARHFNQYLLAMNAYTSSLDWMKQSLGPDHPNIAALFGNIGNVCLEMEAYDRAYMFYQEVLRVEEKCYGKKHPEIAVTLFNIGTIEYARGNYANAIKAFQSTMKIQKSVFGVDSAVIGLASHSVAEVCERVGDYEQAVQSYKVALEIDQLTMGKEHAQVGHLLHKMGKIYYQKLNDLNEGEALCRRAKEVYVTNNAYRESSFVIRSLLGDLANITARQEFQNKDTVEVIVEELSKQQ